MSSPLSSAIAALASADAAARAAAAAAIYTTGRSAADVATQLWRNHAEFQELLGATPVVTVGLAVTPATFSKIRDANGSPRLAQTPPEKSEHSAEKSPLRMAMEGSKKFTVRGNRSRTAR